MSNDVICESGSNLGSTKGFEMSLSFSLGLALALLVKKCAFLNDYTRSIKVKTAVELEPHSGTERLFFAHHVKASCACIV